MELDINVSFNFIGNYIMIQRISKDGGFGVTGFHL